MIALAPSDDAPDRETPLIDLFFQHYKPKQLRATTKKNARLFGIALNQFARYLKHTPLLSHLNDDDVEGFCFWCIEELGLSPYTANCYRSKIIALWNFLARKRFVEKYPTVVKMHEPRRIPRAWTPQQLSALFQACDDLKGRMGRIPSALWWHAIHAVIWDTGERISATLALEWRDLAWDTRFIVSRAENRKGKTEDKAFRLHNDTIAVLQKLMETSTGDFLFPVDCTLATVYNRYKRLLKSAGLPTDRKHMLHCMRRSTASFYEAAGGNATDLLDHSSRDITKRFYLDTRVLPMKGPAMMEFRPKAG